MKENYQKKLDLLLDHLISEHSNCKPKLLLHSCCGPCSGYVTEYLTNYFDITVFYFNPNIYPYSEYLHRLDTQKALLNATGWASLIDDGYDHAPFLNAAKSLENEPEGGVRCAHCFQIRLEQTARKAAELGFPYFGTTLTVSPHKNAELLNTIGQEIGERYNVIWLPSDFKKKEGYKRSIEISKQYNLYRQNYCGCEFSLRDAQKPSHTIDDQTSHSERNL